MRRHLVAGLSAMALLAPVAGIAGVMTATRASAATQTLGQRALTEAQRHAGKPYKWATVGPDRFDCSGFTLYVFKRLGKNLPDNSAQQFSVVRRISPASKQLGDLIFTKRDGRIRHVGIYAGGTMMWASVQTGDTVRKQSFAGREYLVGRVL